MVIRETRIAAVMSFATMTRDIHGVAPSGVTREAGVPTAYAVEETRSTVPDEPLENRFERLAKAWKRDTLYESFGKRIVTHPAYLEIIGMKQAAIPLILRDMQRGPPAQWFWALISLTGSSPVTQEHSGDMQRMTEAWLEWGKANHYLTE